MIDTFPFLREVVDPDESIAPLNHRSDVAARAAVGAPQADRDPKFNFFFLHVSIAVWEIGLKE